MTITVFGSARCGPSSPDYRLAAELGRLLAAESYVLCNGGFGGTMEAAARGAKEAGGSTVGVTISLFGQKPNQWIDREIRTTTLVERLMKLIELGDAYVVLPGATGTLLEFAAVWEMMAKGLIPEKPLIAFRPFWAQLVQLIQDRLTVENPSALGLKVTEVTTPDECLRALKNRRT